jgi:dipeptidyl aminopeptidase/acylaminoacyl peptidase
MRRPIIVVLSVALVALVTAYLGAGYVIYDRLSAVRPGCPDHAANTPARFTVHSSRYETFDTTPYQMPAYEDIRFPSRQPGLSLAGWYVEVGPDAPAVILVHGLGSCKHDHTILIPAGMLHRAGFNVLMLDLRDQGFSDVEDGRTAIGNEEYLDALGAWDWLVARGVPPGRIGVYGVSLGAATTLTAFAQEPRVAAAFVDSPFADLPTVIAEELARNDYPTFLTPGGILAARLVAGDDLLAHSPQDAVRRDAGRPLFVVHGDADTRVDQHHSHDLAALAAQTPGASVTTWFPGGIGHVEAVLALTRDYDQRLVGFFGQALGR